MDQTPSRSCRLLRPTGALFQADMYLAELAGAEGFTKQITVWQMRPELCAQSGAFTLLLEDLKQAAQLSTAVATHVLDVWRSEEELSIAVEHVGGITLAQAAQLAADKGDDLSLDLVLSVLLEAARALEIAHAPQLSRGPVVHGDVRPQNVLLGAEGSVKLTGFGFARFLPALEPRGLFATWDGWCYQPPERLEQGPVDPRSDIFSLGLVLLEAATGLRPWGTDDSNVLLALLEEGDVAPYPESMSTGINEIVRRACAPAPDERYESAGELAEALHGLLFERRCVASCSTLVRDFVADIQGTELYDDEEPTVTTISRVDPAAQARAVAQTKRPGAVSFPPQLEPPSHEMVGRTKELRAVSRALAATARGVGTAMLVVGEAGMGRTRLLTEVAIRLSSSELPRAWLHVQARPAERAVPFSGLLRLLAIPVGLGIDCALSDVGERADRLKAFGVEDQAVAAIRGVAGLDEVADPARTTGLISRAVTAVVASLAQEQTTVVAWDDLQWTDEASLLCFGEILHQIPSMPVVALATAPVDFELTWRPGTVERVVLDPLTPRECEEYVVDLVDEAEGVAPRLLDALSAHTGGNPRLLSEVMELLRQAGRLDLDGYLLEVTDPDVELPQLKDVLLGRVKAMGQKVYVTALAAAMAGPALSEALVAAATNLDEATVKEALGALVDEHKLLVADGEGVAFSSERHRQAILDLAPSKMIEGLRRPLAQAILDSATASGGLDELAVSLLIQAGEEGAAAEILGSAARRHEELGNVEGSLARYRRALSLARSSDAHGEAFALQVLVAVGRTAFQVMRFDVAEKALREAVELARRCDEIQLGAEAELQLLGLLARQGKLQEAIERAKDAIPMAEATGSSLMLARAYAAIGEAYQQWGQYGPDLRYIEAAVSFAAESGDSVTLGRCLQLAVTHAAGVGQDEKTRELFDQARPIAQESKDPSLRGHLIKAETLLMLFERDYEGAIRKALEGVTLARHNGLNQLEVVMLHNAGDAYLRLGQIREAQYYCTESLRRCRAGRYDRLAEVNEMYVNFVEAVHLNEAEGLAKLQSAIERAEEHGRIWNLQQGHELLGRALLSQGDQAAAVEHLRAALRYANESGVRFFVEEASRWLGQAEGTV